MAKIRETSLEERKLIIRFVKEGKSYREVGKILQKSFATIQSIVKKFKKTGNVENESRSGHPSKLTTRTKRNLVRKIKQNPHISAPKLKAQLEEETGACVSASTIRRALIEADFHGRSSRKKGWVSEVNAKKRLSFAKEYQNQPSEFWERVIFSDESKFNLFGPDGNQKVWRKPGTEMYRKNLKATIKHGGGSVLVWGCMSAAGVGNLTFIEEKMNRFGYIEILKAYLKNSALKMGLENNFIFQHDNDPKHTALDTKMWLLYNVSKMLNTPPQSPDLNVIEHVWAHLEQKVRLHRISNKEDLKNALKEEWAKITPEFCKKLVSSMPRRLIAVKKAKGYPTKY